MMPCWDSNSRVRTWAQAHNMSYFSLEQHFWSRMNEAGGVIPMLSAKGKTVVIAEGSTARQGSVNLTLANFPKGTVAEVWGQSTLANLSQVLRAYPDAKALVGGPYYLDTQSPWQEGEPTGLQHHYGWMDTWQNFYEAEPLIDSKLTAEERQRVIGGMAEMWGEQVSVSVSIDALRAPRRSKCEGRSVAVPQRRGRGYHQK